MNNGPLTMEGALLCQNKTGPEKIKHLMGQHYEMFAGYEQQDSHEFLTLYLNQVQDEFEKAVKQNKISKNSLSLDKYLTHTTETTITCSECNHTQSRKETDQQLIVDLSFLKEQSPDSTCTSTNDFTTPPKRARYRDSTLNECIAQLFKDEIFTLDCLACKKQTIHHHKHRITQLPKQLIVVLKKFDIYNHKILNQIEFYKNLSLEKYCNDIGKTTYNLNAVSLHAGDTNCGHYTAYVIVDGQEYLCDDYYVTAANIDYNDQRAYILTYSIAE